MTGEVAVLGVGMHPWDKWGRNFVEYGVTATRAALTDAGLDWRDIGSIIGADTVRGGYPGYVAGATFAKALGWQGARVTSVYAACASGAQAVDAARAQILSGLAEVVLVVGADAAPKGFFRPAGGDRPDDPDWLRFRILGATNPVYFGLYARRRMAMHGDTPGDFAQVKVKNAAMGALNPHARNRRRVTAEEVAASAVVADPLRLLDICATSDGGAAVVLSSMEFARRQGHADPVRIRAVATVTPRYPNTVLDLPDIATDSAAAVDPFVNAFAGTLADLGGLPSLHDAVREAGRLPWEVTVDVCPPYTHVPQRALLEAVSRLRGQGFRICADGVGDGDVPLRLLSDISPELVKLDASLLARPAVVRSMRTLCDELGALLAVEGVETEGQCAAALAAGAQLAQGELFAPPARLPAADVYVPPRSPADVGVPRSGPSVREFVRPAALLPATASAGQVRALLTGSPDVSGVLLVDTAGVPVRSVHRSRFLLSMSGRYGHALYADRPAAKLGDPPRTVGIDATAWEVLDVVAVGGRDRTSDDVAVVDECGRCVGVVRLADLVRALAETRVEEAAGLNPLTRLPGSDAIIGEVDRRIASGRAFALSWLDVDHFKQVNDGAGFAAGDELIRAVGRALQQAATDSTRVGHIGGDDFLVLAEPEGLDPLAASLLDAPWAAGGRPVTLSLATVLCAPGSVSDHRQAAACLAPLKKAAKALHGASWVLGRAGTPGHETRRGGETTPAAARCGAP